MEINIEIKRHLLRMLRWISRIIASFLMIIACASCQRSQPIPKDKGVFVGLWHSRSGFQIEIRSSGIANVIPIVNTENPDYYKLEIGVTPEYAKEMLFGFNGDSVLWVSKPTVRYKAFRIDRNPFLDGDTTKLILNGVVLIKMQ